MLDHSLTVREREAITTLFTLDCVGCGNYRLHTHFHLAECGAGAAFILASAWCVCVSVCACGATPELCGGGGDGGGGGGGGGGGFMLCGWGNESELMEAWSGQPWVVVCGPGQGSLTPSLHPSLPPSFSPSLLHHIPSVLHTLS